MFNKNLIKKICNVSASFEELEEFVTNINKKEFDLDNPFQKYYSLENILFAISRYENKKINDKYLSYWMNAYNWIIMGGFKIEDENKEMTFQDWIVWEISDWLDSLSFFDDADNWYNLDDYKNSFNVIDKIYQDNDNWKCIFAHTDEWGDNEDDVVLLTVNDTTNEFVKIYGTLDYINEDVKIPRIKLGDLEKEIGRLKKLGYRELRYGLFDEIE